MNSDTSSEELLHSNIGITFYSCLIEPFFNVNLNQKSGLLKMVFKKLPLDDRCNRFG